jgi:hypothetical protein
MVGIATALQVGNPLTPTLDVNGTAEPVSVNGQLNVSTSAGSNVSSIYTDVNNDLKIEAYNNLILDHDDNGVFIGSADAGNQVVTNAGTADISNKRIIDTLYFTDGVTIADEGQIAILSPNHEFEIKANYGDLDLKTSAVDSDVNITSIYGNVNLNPNATGATNVNGILNVNDNLNVTYVAGSTVNDADGSLTIQDGAGTSQIHINGNTKDIELLPASGSKAFYGSAATEGNEIATVGDLQALSSGLDWKVAVNLLYDDSTPTLSGDSETTPLVVDGHSPLDLSDKGYRVLITNGNDAGIYVYDQVGTAWTLSRAADADVFAELVGAAVFVMEGDQYGATSWVQNNHYLSDFTGQNWIQFSGQGTYIGSNSIQIDGNQINAIVDGTRGLAIDGDGVYVKIGDGLSTDGSGNLAIETGTGFDTSSGSLNFATGYGVRKHTQVIGDATELSFYVEHGFGTRSVTVQVFQTSAPYAQVEADVEHTDTEKVTIKFAVAPASSEYEVVVVG